MGPRIVSSSCDFLEILNHTKVPHFWQNVLISLGSVRGLVPQEPGITQDTRAAFSLADICEEGKRRVVKTRELWLFQDVMAESIFYNQHISGRWGARVLEAEGTKDVLTQTHHSGEATMLRVSEDRRRAAAGVLKVYSLLAERGITHVADLVTGKNGGRIAIRPHGSLPKQRSAPFDPVISVESYGRLRSGFPKEWLDAIDRANQIRATNPGKPWEELWEEPQTYYSVDPGGKWVRQITAGKAGALFGVSPSGRLRPFPTSKPAPRDARWNKRFWKS